MSNTPTRREIREAAMAVTELAVYSLRPEYLCWTKTVNLGVAEFVWNTACLGEMAALWFSEDDPRLAQLHDRLAELRRTKWPDLDCLVFGLDVNRKGDEAVFTFDLSWNECETVHPCEIDWDPRGVSPSMVN